MLIKKQSLFLLCNTFSTKRGRSEDQTKLLQNVIKIRILGIGLIVSAMLQSHYKVCSISKENKGIERKRNESL